MKKDLSLKIKNYKRIQDLCYVIKVMSFLFAFLSVLYWFSVVTKLNFLDSLSFIFEPIFDFIRLFYVQKSIDVEAVDLSGIICCILFILLAVVSNIISENAEKRTEYAKVEQIKIKKIEDKREQEQIEQNYIKEMKKYDKFLILVDFKIRKVQSYLFEDIKTTEEDLSSLKIKLMSELFNKINDNYIIEKAKHAEQGFYIVGLIEKTPDCIINVTKAIKEIAKKYAEFNIVLSHDLSFDAISRDTNIAEKLELLEKILQLNYANSTLTTSLFKTCFEIISNKKLNFIVLGKYQFLVKGKLNNYELYDVKII